MKRFAMVLLFVLASIPLLDCGGGSVASGGGGVTAPVTNSGPSSSYSARPSGLWVTLPQTMPINPVHAALLHTGKILIVSGSGNCPPQQAGCPQGPPYSQG
ncbi:MAG: hypothetical protein JO356_17910, partial [Acidobacteria bacterium]|nr:hypothetical protein [Acidobacteriota bacterium]